MFSLRSVVLIALDVVKGPYLHCHAPLNPFVQTTHAAAAPAHTNYECSSKDGDKEKDNGSCHSASDCKSNTIHGNSCKCDASSYTATSADRLGGFSDVFVPRSEFCRRVMYLMEAEAGLLYLFYPEEIAGLHYQRKTLRYTLCFVFGVDVGLVTPSVSLTESLIQPYSVVLTGIMEELRKAELAYGYMSTGFLRASSHSTSTGPPRCVSHKTEATTTMDDSEAQIAHVDAPAASGNGIGGGVGSTSESAAMFSALQPFSHPAESFVSATGVAAASATQTAPLSATSDELAHPAGKCITRVNVFLTPLQDPALLQWTPLEEMIATLYACLSREERQLAPRIKRPPRTVEAPEANEDGPQLTNTKEREKLLLPLQERTVSVRLSQAHSYHVRRVTQPYVLQHHTLDEVPIPIRSYTAEVFEWVDLTIQDVFKAVDGHRTIANIVQILAAGHESFEEEERRESRMLSPLSSPYQAVLPSHAMTWTRLPCAKTAAGGVASSSCLRGSNTVPPSAAAAHLSSHGADTRVLSPLSCGSRPCMSPFLMPSTGQIPPTSFRVAHERAADDTVTNSHDSGQVWSAELELIVLEALQHLEVCNYVRIVRPCQLESTYNTTRAFSLVMSNRQHTSRRIIGQRMLLVEEEFYRLRKRQQAAQHDRQQVHPRRLQESKDGVITGFSDSPNDVYILRLPAVLLAKASVDWQDKKKDEAIKGENEKRELQPQEAEAERHVEKDVMLDSLAIVEQTAHSLPLLGAMPTSNDVVNEPVSELEEAAASGTVYSESDINAAAAASLCALGKFTNNTVGNVQWEMRCIPGWSTAFAGWEEMCCKALVEIALLNDWLVEVGGRPASCF
ncbi:hypothetical protein TraAM80_02525 [Trypanosoma rangeli]|uniref:Uncharacterized protein n=1 Tax=Trypanosoma rangeli TaxID=5698 RepID=A0A3R7NX68_TRYRA|nr:uncharacterized protein TraAM80_02525 [Trypanosoma rangeli]RNF09093.1 hypothetical protein TraAM80_02525 [Trypanosoma rangeli]|eukprot:RNF09093.1 hypothetical protein TraAM80_02525 [Trypanosoma rangeli]